MFDAPIGIFLIFPHDDHVHAGMAGEHEGVIGDAGANIREQAQGLAHRDIQALEPTTLGRGDGGFQKHPGAAQRLPGPRVDAGAPAALISGLADFNGLQGEVGARRRQHPQGGVHYFGTDAVAPGDGDGDRRHKPLLFHIYDSYYTNYISYIIRQYKADPAAGQAARSGGATSRGEAGGRTGGDGFELTGR